MNSGPAPSSTGSPDRPTAVLAAAVWPELDRPGITLVVPLGSTEQHGPHLPLDTDTRIAGEVARRAVAARTGGGDATGAGGAEAEWSAEEGGPGSPDVLLAPAIAYGASGEHEGFPGTVSIGTEALELLLVEFGRSACRWASRIVFVNGHGGNAQALLGATRLLRTEGRDVAWFPCAFPGADAHAGCAETAVLLAIAPDTVRVGRAEAGETRPIADLLEELRRSGVAGVSANGVLGDPAGADAAAGARDVAAAAGRLSAALATWTVDEHGRLQ